MDKIRELAVRFNQWLGNHWRMVIWCMLMVMMMQQCTISRLRWEVTQLTQNSSRPVVLSGPVSDSVSGKGGSLFQPADTVALQSLETIKAAQVDEEHNSAGSIWLVALVVVILAGSAFAVFYMRRNAIYPFGIVVRGKLCRDMVYHIKVSNKSRRPVEVSEPLVTFIMGGSARKFRANVAQLPMTLDKGTSFEADINLAGLVRANLELANAKAVGMSIVTNGKRHNTIPTPVKIKTI